MTKTSFAPRLMLASAAAALLAAVPTFAAEPPKSQQAGASGAHAPAPRQITIEKITPAYWEVTIHNPPFNIFGPETIPQLQDVVDQMENDPNLKVVVFQSDVPGYFLNHYNFTPPLSESTKLPGGPTRLFAIPDLLARISKSHVVSIVKLRGNVTGVGGELSLASDMRFASRENVQISQWEVGAALVPGGGPMARMPRLMGRGRALEMLLGADNIDGETAEKYGYVNRALPDAELDAFVDRLARRIASFDGDALADVKQAVNYASLPPESEYAAGWDLFIRSANRPEAQHRLTTLMQRGLQQDPEVEKNLTHYTEASGKR